MVGKTIAKVEMLDYAGKSVSWACDTPRLRLTFTDGSVVAFKAKSTGYGGETSIEEETDDVTSPSS